MASGPSDTLRSETTLALVAEHPGHPLAGGEHGRVRSSPGPWRSRERCSRHGDPPERFPGLRFDFALSPPCWTCSAWHSRSERSRLGLLVFLAGRSISTASKSFASAG